MNYIKFKKNVRNCRTSNKFKWAIKIIHLTIQLIIINYIIINALNEKNILNKDINSIKKYFKICNQGKLINEKTFKKRLKPKVSIVIALYNKEKYLLRLLRSIQNQIFKNIEIIFVDDSSTDNSINIVKTFQINDRRISIIRNKKNKGTLISRNLGILKSIGNYILIPDADDIFSKNIIKICYNLAIKYNYEMIRYNVYADMPYSGLTKIVQSLESKPIYQPELSDFLFYGFGTLRLHDFTLWNKFIKGTAIKRAFNNMDSFYLNQYMIIFEDGLINYSLYRTVKSFFLLKRIGYYYVFQKENSVQYKKGIERNVVKYIFLYLKFILDNSKNNKHEKDMALYIFRLYSWQVSLLDLINDNFQLYEYVINFFLNYEFIPIEDKNKFIHLKEIKVIYKMNLFLKIIY